MHIMCGTWKSKGIKLNTWKYDLIEQLNKIIELNQRIEGNGIYITDIMHVVKANNPASQSERGQQQQQKKMNITFARNFQNISHTMSFQNISLADCIRKVCLTNATKKKL